MEDYSGDRTIQPFLVRNFLFGPYRSSGRSQSPRTNVSSLHFVEMSFGNRKEWRGKYPMAYTREDSLAEIPRDQSMEKFDYSAYYRQIQDLKKLQIPAQSICWTEQYRPPDRIMMLCCISAATFCARPM